MYSSLLVRVLPRVALVGKAHRDGLTRHFLPLPTEIEFAALSRQRLDQRIGTQQRLEQEALAWQAKRNAAATKVNWSFTTEKARDKLKNRYAEFTKVTDEIKMSDHQRVRTITFAWL